MAAAKWGHVAILKQLLAAGAPVDVASESGWTALQTAAYEGKLDVTNVLLAAGVSVNFASTLGWTALHRAARAGDPLMVQALVVGS